MYFNIAQASEDVAAAAASAASTAAPAAATHIRVVAKTAAARIRFGAAPVAVATDTLLPVGIPEIYHITPGQATKVAAIQDVGAGVVNVTFLTANAPATSPGNYVPGATY